MFSILNAHLFHWSIISAVRLMPFWLLIPYNSLVFWWWFWLHLFLLFLGRTILVYISHIFNFTFFIYRTVLVWWFPCIALILLPMLWCYWLGLIFLWDWVSFYFLLLEFVNSCRPSTLPLIFQVWPYLCWSWGVWSYFLQPPFRYLSLYFLNF